MALFVLTRGAELVDIASADPVLRDFSTLDSERFLAAARLIAGGDLWCGKRAFEFAPLYAYYLAAFQALGLGMWWVYSSQVVLGALGAWLVHRIGAAGFGKSVGVAAASLWCLYGAARFLELKLMDTALATTLLVASLYFMRPSKSSLVSKGWAGFFLGACSLARPNTLLCVPLFGLWLASRGVWRPRRGHSFEPVAAFLLGVALALSPALVRNLVVTGEWTVASNQGGITFYQGNNAGATGTYAKPNGFSGDPEKQEAESKRLAEAAVGRPLAPGEVQSHWYAEGRAYLASDICAALELWARKLALWFGSAELSVEYVFLAERDLFPSLWLVSLPFGIILGFAALGLRRRAFVGMPALLIAVLAANLVSTVVFFFASRYRAPAVPAVELLAGVGVAKALSTSSWRRRAIAGAIAGLSLIPWSPEEQLERASYFFLLGNSYFQAGDRTRAVDFFERAAKGNPTSWKIRHNLGEAYGSVGRYQVAVDELTAARALDPNAPSTQRALAYYRRLLSAPP